MYIIEYEGEIFQKGGYSPRRENWGLQRGESGDNTVCWDRVHVASVIRLGEVRLSDSVQKKMGTKGVHAVDVVVMVDLWW